MMFALGSHLQTTLTDGPNRVDHSPDGGGVVDTISAEKFIE